MLKRMFQLKKQRSQEETDKYAAIFLIFNPLKSPTSPSLFPLVTSKFMNSHNFGFRFAISRLTIT